MLQRGATTQGSDRRLDRGPTPLAPGKRRKQPGDDAAAGDEHPLERAVVLVRLEAGERLDPVRPHSCQNGNNAGDTSQNGFSPEDRTQPFAHECPLEMELPYVQIRSDDRQHD